MKHQKEEEKEERLQREKEEREERHRRQDKDREARQQPQEIKELQAEAELQRQKIEVEEAQRRHELEMRHLELEQTHQGPVAQTPTEDRAKTPKPPYGKDDLDAYLQQFEWSATTARWDRNSWAIMFSTLLSGRALEVYSDRLSEVAAIDYDQMKLALMKRYDLTEDGYQRKLGASRP